MVAVAWPDNREVSSVEGRDSGDTETFGGDNYRGVHGAEGQVSVSVHQFSDPQPVAHSDRVDLEVSRGEVANKADFRVGTESSLEEVDDFGRHQGRNDQWTGMGQQELQAGSVVPVVRVDVCVEWSRVDDQRDDRASRARISSMRSETSERPLRPAAAAPSLRPE